ncbi:lipoprotein-anchoring transpeptidase ErfK/SrfK [Rhodoplanes tepidamans]|nr:MULTISPECIES: L,D-transpeptidase [Rhodoplanes]MDQ0353765.1 lipoprotein-anchoring transpeptidase ErfK/SrfK [Rhodoplanes tepidamans]
MARSAKLSLVIGAVAVLAGASLTAARAEPLSLFAPDGYRSSSIDRYIRDDRVDPAPRAGVPAHLRRQVVAYSGPEAPGTIIIDTPNTYLYLVMPGGKAMRYGIGVGREGFTWSGVEHVTRMAEWPDWHPPADMLRRQPYLPRFMAGGPGNPLGARAMYLGSSVYRIHGTNAPETIGQRVSSGCIRLANEDVIDLYGRVKTGAKVVVMPMSSRGVAGISAPPARTADSRLGGRIN